LNFIVVLSRASGEIEVDVTVVKVEPLLVVFTRINALFAAPVFPFMDAVIDESSSSCLCNSLLLVL
jgi:hypothetical protein